MTIGFIVLCLVGAVVFLFWVLSVDVLLRKIYTDQRDLWVSLGSPPGVFWSPRETSWFRGAKARQTFITSVWPYKPTWTKRTPAFERLWLQIFVLGMMVFLIGAMVLVSVMTGSRLGVSQQILTVGVIAKVGDHA